MMYNQVRLVKDKQVDVVWIPSKFALKGKTLAIMKENGWVVDEVYNSLNDDMVIFGRDDYRHQRKASDIYR